MSGKAESVKFIVFKVANYHFALPIFAALKVVNYPPESSDKMRAAGLVQIAQHTLMLLDIHEKLMTSYTHQSAWAPPFLLVAQASQGELRGIPVDEPPILVEFSRDEIQSLPKSYQQSGLLHIATHVAVLSQDDQTFTIFLLDINRVLNVTANTSIPRLIMVEQ